MRATHRLWGAGLAAGLVVVLSGCGATGAAGGSTSSSTPPASDSSSSSVPAPGGTSASDTNPASATTAASAATSASASTQASDTNSASAGSSGATGTLSVAVLVAGGSNAYQAAGVAAIKAAAPGLGVSVDVFDANFDAAKQYAQFQTAINSKKYGGIIIDPADGAGVVPLVKQAADAGIKVAAWNQPIGSDYSTPNPTVAGVVAQAMLPINDSGRISGELTIKACAEAKANPCQVAALYFQKGSAYDTAIMKGFNDAIASVPSIKLVAGADTQATRQGGLAAAQTLLTGHPDINVMIGTSQAVSGAVGAVSKANHKVYLIGQALTKQGAQQVASGQLYGGSQAMAGEEGKLALEQLVNAMRGAPVTPGINPGEYLKSPCVDGVLADNVAKCSFDFNG